MEVERRGLWRACSSSCGSGGYALALARLGIGSSAAPLPPSGLVGSAASCRWSVGASGARA
eukprot:2997408-Alexandrium_andersonii.AAC.1